MNKKKRNRSRNKCKSRRNCCSCQTNLWLLIKDKMKKKFLNLIESAIEDLIKDGIKEIIKEAFRFIIYYELYNLFH